MMTKKHSTKKALIASVLSLVLCFSMLVGTTFAWFTDSVTSANNIIKSGNLDVELYYQTEGQTDWTKVTDTTSVFKENALWEPGHTEVVKLKVVNEGTLALKYQLGVNVASEVGSVNVNDVEFKLSDFIKFAVIDGAQSYTRDQAIAAAEANGATALKTAYNSTVTALVAKNDTDSDEKIVTMVVYMPTTVGNDANAKTGAAVPTINLGINLFATQQTAESDSFNNQYDKDARHPDFTVTSVEDLATALASGGKIQVNGTLNAGATQDVPNWTNAPAEFIFDATTLDALKGGKYVLEQGSRYGVVGLISAGESLALSDMEITANSQWPVYLSNYGGTLTLEDIDVTATQGAGIYPYGTNGTTTIKSATVNQKALSDEFASSTPWAGTAIATSNGHNLIIEDGTYIGSTWGVYVYNSGANVTINGGTFKAPKVIQADGVWSTGGNKSVVTVNDGNFDGALYLDWGTTPPEIYINGGNFTNFSATVNGAAKLVIKGGTFDTDPSAYVAPGYQVTNNGDGTYTVGAYKISTGAELVDAIANGTTAVSLSNDIVLNTQLEVNSELTILGNGNTITAPANGTRVVNVMDNTGDVTVTLVGVKLDAADKERGISFYNNSGDLDVTIIDCKITAKYYGVNVAGQNAKATLNIKDSTLTGYCAFQTYSPNTVATFDNCVLEGVNLGYNNNQYPTANNFATVVVNSLANNSTLTFNNCTIIATEKESATAPADQWPATQAHIIDDATGTTINWNNCTFIKNGVEVSAPESIN